MKDKCFLWWGGWQEDVMAEGRQNSGGNSVCKVCAAQEQPSRNGGSGEVETGNAWCLRLTSLAFCELLASERPCLNKKKQVCFLRSYKHLKLTSDVYIHVHKHASVPI